MTQRQEVANFRFGNQTLHLSIPQAAQLVENYTRAEQKACERLTEKINRDSWLVSFVAEANNEKLPPTRGEWLRPINTARSAKSAAKGGNVPAAKQHLAHAVSQYNHVHRKWAVYQTGLQKGGERAIKVMEVTFAIMTGVATGGYAAAAELGVLGTAAVAGGTKALQSGIMVSGKSLWGVQGKVDWVTLIASVGEEFVASLVGGALSAGFLRVLGPRLSRTYKLDPQLALKMKSLRGGSKVQKFWVEFVNGVGISVLREATNRAAKKAKGKELSASQFLDMVAAEYTASLAKSESTKQYLSGLAGLL